MDSRFSKSEAQLLFKFRRGALNFKKNFSSQDQDLYTNSIELQCFIVVEIIKNNFGMCLIVDFFCIYLVGKWSMKKGLLDYQSKPVKNNNVIAINLTR